MFQAAIVVVFAFSCKPLVFVGNFRVLTLVLTSVVTSSIKPTISEQITGL